MGNTTVRELATQTYVARQMEDDLVGLAEALADAELRLALVLDGERPVGVIDERDLYAYLDGDRFGFRARQIFAIELASEVSALPADASLSTAVARLSTASDDVVPVVESDGRFIGVVTAKQVFAAVAQQHAPPSRSPHLRLIA